LKARVRHKPMMGSQKSSQRGPSVSHRVRTHVTNSSAPRRQNSHALPCFTIDPARPAVLLTDDPTWSRNLVHILCCCCTSPRSQRSRQPRAQAAQCNPSSCRRRALGMEMLWIPSLCTACMPIRCTCVSRVRIWRWESEKQTSEAALGSLRRL
jgi:hypothetical protein